MKKYLLSAQAYSSSMAPSRASRVAGLKSLGATTILRTIQSAITVGKYMAVLLFNLRTQSVAKHTPWSAVKRQISAGFTPAGIQSGYRVLSINRTGNLAMN